MQATGWLRCNAEIGYWIGEAYWRRGITSDAVRQVTDWAFAAMPDAHAHARRHLRAATKASQAVVRKCGYVREGVLQQSAHQGRRGDRPRRLGDLPHEIARRDADIDAALAITAANAMERS